MMKLGEAAKRLANTGYFAAESVDWSSAIANRNWLIHRYDELDRALKPTLSQLEKSLRDNNYWLTTVLSQSQSDPQRLELARTRDADYKSITLAEINVLARKYLKAENALLVTIKPK